MDINQQQNVNVDFYLRRSATTGGSPSFTEPGRAHGRNCSSGIGYWSSYMCWLVYLTATDKVDIYGSGYAYGNTTAPEYIGNAKTWFKGVRIGA